MARMNTDDCAVLTKAFFTTDTEWMGNGWDSRQSVLGCYPDRIRVIRG